MDYVSVRWFKEQGCVQVAQYMTGRGFFFAFACDSCNNKHLDEWKSFEITHYHQQGIYDGKTASTANPFLSKVITSLLPLFLSPLP